MTAAPPPAEEPSVRAERLFAGLAGEVEPLGGDAPPAAPAPPEPDHPAPRAEPTSDEPTEGEVLDFLFAARDAIERTAKAVKGVRARVTLTEDDLAALGGAVERALLVMNERLTSLEMLVLGKAGPDARAAEEAVKALRGALARTDRKPEY